MSSKGILIARQILRSATAKFDAQSGSIRPCSTAEGLDSFCNMESSKAAISRDTWHPLRFSFKLR